MHRADDAGQDPGGRQGREHPRPEPLRQGPPDRDVGDRRDRAGAEALDEPGGDEDRHRRREAADQEAEREQAEPVRNGRVSPPRSIMIPATTIPSRLPRKNAEKTQP